MLCLFLEKIDNVVDSRLKILPLLESPPNKTISGPDWLRLPHEATAMILSCLSTTEIPRIAQVVCRSWLAIRCDPLVWQTIDMHHSGSWKSLWGLDLEKMCLIAVE